MKYSKGLFSLNINIINNEIHLNGQKYDWYGNIDEEVSIKYKIGSKVNFKIYSKEYKGILTKINNKSVLIEHEGQEIKKTIQHFVDNNLYPRIYYRLEHSITGIGPFQSEIENPNLEKIIRELSRSLDRYEYPDPFSDNRISKIWNNLTDEGKKSCKFACFSISILERWFPITILNQLLNGGFVIKSYQKGYDFTHSVTGSSQTLLIPNIDIDYDQYRYYLDRY